MLESATGRAKELSTEPGDIFLVFLDLVGTKDFHCVTRIRTAKFSQGTFWGDGMIRGLLITGLLFAGTFVSADSFLVKPDPAMTQGDYCETSDPDFVDFRYSEKVAYCARNVSYWTKKAIYDQYQIPEKCRAEFTVDHYIPLFMGGSNHNGNLWPEHKLVKATRQNLEMDLYVEMKNGRIGQKEAIEIITQAKMHPPKVNPSRCMLDHMNVAAGPQQPEHQ